MVLVSQSKTESELKMNDVERVLACLDIKRSNSQDIADFLHMKDKNIKEILFRLYNRGVIGKDELGTSSIGGLVMIHKPIWKRIDY